MSALLEAVPVGQDQVVSWGPEGAPTAPADPTEQDQLAKWIGPTAHDLDCAGVIRCRNAMAEAKLRSDLGLEMWAETVSYQLADDEGDPETVALRQAMYQPVALGIAYELKRRARLRNSGAVQTPTPSRQYEALRELIAEVKASVSIVDLIEREVPVWPLLSGKKESHSPCLLCAGRDRFVITHGPPSLGWCRRCEWGCDVISYAATMWGLDTLNGDQLRECAVRLAREYLGITEEAA